MPLSDAETIQRLRERVGELEEEIRQLRCELTQDSDAFIGILTRQQSALLMALYRRGTANYAFLDSVTEEYGLYNRYEGEMHINQRMKIAMWKLRKKLKHYGIEIHVYRGVGYHLDDENKAKLRALMEKKDG